MELDIYDFDKTVIPFDSGSRFCLFCFRHYPQTLVSLPVIGIAALLYFSGTITLTTFKRYCFCFVRLINGEKASKKFWNKYQGKVYPWFQKSNRARYTVIISASPDFLLREIAARLEVDSLICSRHNFKTGSIIGENCRGGEKVRRFKSVFSNARVVDVYSDGIVTDRPLFSLAQNCFHIVNGKKIPFDYKVKYGVD